jgi:hypothetical protein
MLFVPPAKMKAARPASPCVKRRQHLADDRKRIRRSLFNRLLSGASQANQQATAVLGIGVRKALS